MRRLILPLFALAALTSSVAYNVRAEEPPVPVDMPLPAGCMRTFDLPSNPFTTQAGSNIVSVITSEPHHLRTGRQVAIRGVNGAVNGIPAIELNNVFHVVVTSRTTFQIQTAIAAYASGVGGYNTAYMMPLCF